MTEQTEHRSFKSSAALAIFNNNYLLGLGLIIILLAGASAFVNVPRIEDPRIVPRYPQITTLLPGASAARVEALVTDPIEDALREIPEILKIDSQSIANISIINVELQPHVGAPENEQVFSEIQNQIKDVSARLPREASQPFFNDKNNAVAYSKVISIAWERDSDPPLAIMRRLAEVLADEFRSIAGTDIVRIFGAPDEEVAVVARGAQLAALGLDANRLAAQIAAADVKLPAGALRSKNRDLYVELAADIDTVERVRAIPVIQNETGAFVTVGDIATVEKRWLEPARDVTLSNGNRSVLIAVQTSDEIRLDQWAKRTEQMLTQFANDNQGLAITTVFDQNVFTEQRLSSLGGNLLAGALLVMAVVLVSMGWRASLIVGSSLPLSAALAFFGLSLFGQQLHQMAIFGMIIAIGLLIDNAIVITDEIKKNIDHGASPVEAIQASLQHLFVPLLASTLTTILGFMPVFLLPGAMGDFVGPIAIAVVLALTASFFTAVVIIPVLGARYLHARSKRTSERESWWESGFSSKRLSQRYKTLLAKSMARPKLTAALCLTLPLLGFLLASTLGQQFFPAADRNQFEIEVRLAPDTAIEKTSAVAREIEQVLRQEEGVEQVHWRMGGTYPTIYYNRINRVQSNNAYAHAMVYTDTLASARRLTTELPALLDNRFSEAQIIVAPFAQGPPVDAPVAFHISGPDLSVLRELGEQLRAIMHTVPGVLQTRATVSGGLPKLEFVADEYAAREAGFSLGNLATQLQSNLEGQTGGALLEDLEELPVVVRLAESERDSVAMLESLLLSSPRDNALIPVSSMGKFELRPELSSIARRDGVRTNKVLAFLARDVLPIDVTGAVLARLDDADFIVPTGYKFLVGGDAAEQSNAFASLFTYLPVLLMLMIATIVLSFRSLRLAAIIGLVAMLSVGLGMFSLWIGGYARGFNAIIGSVGLIGVAINGAIVVLASIRSNSEARAGKVEAIIDETVGSTRHIVSTTLTTVGGFIPLLVFTGGEFWPPLAIVIAGGVFFSISLSLLLTPVLFKLCLPRAMNHQEVTV